MSESASSWTIGGLLVAAFGVLIGIIVSGDEAVRREALSVSESNRQKSKDDISQVRAEAAEARRRFGDAIVAAAERESGQDERLIQIENRVTRMETKAVDLRRDVTTLADIMKTHVGLHKAPGHLRDWGGEHPEGPPR